MRNYLPSNKEVHAKLLEDIAAQIRAGQLFVMDSRAERRDSYGHPEQYELSMTMLIMSECAEPTPTPEEVHTPTAAVWVGIADPDAVIRAGASYNREPIMLFCACGDHTENIDGVCWICKADHRE